jgi:serine/threonine protein kinase
MGTVWLANHLTLDVPCAVKFMTGEATRDPNYVARFELEARAIAKLTSPNVVRVLDYDVHEGMPFIAMECLQGEDLGARLQRVGRLDAPTTYRIISQVAHGLAKAHAAGVIHRDLKPDNIFLAVEDEGEVAKLVDFGIAKLTGTSTADGLSSSTQAGSLIGTPAYMSPEQARGVSDLDHRSDLWSLAIIAFECLTGKLPFESNSLGDLFAKILFEPIPIPSEIAPDSSSPALDRWWVRAASRPVAERFGSAIELADALGRALGVVEDVRETLRARDFEVPPLSNRPPVVPRKRMSKALVAALAITIAPFALMLTSGRIDARPTAARSVSAPSAAIAYARVDAPPAEEVTLAAAPAAAPVAEAEAHGPAERRTTAESRTVPAYRLPDREARAKATPIAPASLQSNRVPTPLQAPAAPAATAVDVDFGI